MLQPSFTETQLCGARGIIVIPELMRYMLRWEPDEFLCISVTETRCIQITPSSGGELGAYTVWSVDKKKPPVSYRRLDGRYRLVLPVEHRRYLKILEGETRLKLTVQGDILKLSIVNSLEDGGAGISPKISAP